MCLDNITCIDKIVGDHNHLKIKLLFLVAQHSNGVPLEDSSFLIWKTLFGTLCKDHFGGRPKLYGQRMIIHYTITFGQVRWWLLCPPGPIDKPHKEFQILTLASVSIMERQSPIDKLYIERRFLLLKVTRTPACQKTQGQEKERCA